MPHPFTPLHWLDPRRLEPRHGGILSDSTHRVDVDSLGSPAIKKLLIAASLLAAMAGKHARAQTLPSTVPTIEQDTSGTIPAELHGRRVEEVRVIGNRRVPTAVIFNVVRTRQGDPFNPATIEEDYQRIYELKKFANVEAKVEPTATGVIVAFTVQEQDQIRSIFIRGNEKISTDDILPIINVHEGEVIDRFSIALARQAIEAMYREKNYPFAHVNVPDEPLNANGELIFEIVEGPNIRVRKVDFIGNLSFTPDTLKRRIKSRHWIWLLRPGRLDPNVVEDDVAALRRWYQDKGFRDVRVGRKIIVSPDQTEVMIQFVIEEGPRYIVEQVIFAGNSRISEAELRKELRQKEGMTYDAELVQRDIRDFVRAYSPFGFIYQPQSQDPDYLRIEPKIVYQREQGKMTLLYQFSEGRPFDIGRIVVKGNARTDEKVVLREMRVAPHELYNSGELQDAQQRLQNGPYFTRASITPIGEDPDSRDLLVEVDEAQTASLNLGGGFSSNGGAAGSIVYEQRNFDIANWPESFRDTFTDRAFTGAGQSLRISLEPGTESSNASIRFFEPWLFDQPYSFTSEAYVRDRLREDWDERRAGGRIGFGKRFDYTWSTTLTFRGEDVLVDDIEDEDDRADEIVEAEGHNTLSSVGLVIRRETTNPGFFIYEGTNTAFGIEQYGALGGEFFFEKYTFSFNWYVPLYADLLERRTVLSYHFDTGYIEGESPFFERFYGGGIGSVRGFAYRGISPRSGNDDDPVGGDFSINSTVELGFPLAGDYFRGVVFVDAGSIEEEARIGTIRVGAGAGIRVILPFFGQAPLAVDFGYPVNEYDDDDTQILSFSFGFSN